MAADKLQYEFKVDGTLGVLLKAADLLDKVEKQIKQVSKLKISFPSVGSVGGGLTKMANSFNEINQAAQSIINPVMNVGKGIFETTAEFQKYEAVLANTLGTQNLAQQAMAKIVDFASKTPFQVNELTESYVKLVNRGFNPTMAQMTKLGDLASSTGKPFDQLTEAILDAQTGEFERLKEFGINASKQNDKITFAFKGQSQTVKFTENSIRDYILSLGELKGVQGSMGAISQTLGGQLSNLQDKYTQLQYKVGTQLAPAFTAGMDILSKFMDTLSANFGNFKKVFLDIGTALQPIGNIFSSVFGGAIDKTLSLEGVLNSISWAFKAITPTIQMVSSTIFPLIEYGKQWVVGLIDGFWKVGEAAWQAVGKIMPLLQPLFNSLNSNVDIGYTLGAVFDFISSAIEAVTPWIEAILKIAAPLYDIFTRIVGAVLKIATWLFKAFSPLITNAVWGVGKAVDFVAGGIASIVNGLIDALKYLGLISDETDRNLKKANDIAKIDKVNNLDYSALNKGNQGLLTGGLADFIDKQGNNAPSSLIKTTAGSDLSGNKDTKKNIEGVSGGGSKPTTINISIGKLNEKIEFHTLNFREGETEIERVMTQLLMRIVNNANQYASN